MGLTRMGCSSPNWRTDSTSTSISSKVVRGWNCPARRFAIGKVRGVRAPAAGRGASAWDATVAATSSSPSRAERPRPRPRGLGGWLMAGALLLGGLGRETPAADEFARQQDVSLRAGAGIVVDQDRQAVRGRLGDAHIAWDGRAEHQF